MFSPRWLFFYPALLCLIFGLILTFTLLPGPVSIAPHITLDVHSMIVGCFSILIGAQGIFFSIVARRYAAARGFLPLNDRVKRLLDSLTLEKVLGMAGLLFAGGLAGFFYCVAVWWASNFGPLEYGSLIRTLMASGTAVALAVQIGFTAFLAEIIEIKSFASFGANKSNRTASSKD